MVQRKSSLLQDTGNVLYFSLLSTLPGDYKPRRLFADFDDYRIDLIFHSGRALSPFWNMEESASQIPCAGLNFSPVPE
jgi:hypothetical protein